MKNHKIQTPFTFARRSRDAEKIEEKRLRSGTLVALLFIYLIMFAFHVETTTYGWAVLAVICLLSGVMVVLWLIELKNGDI